MNTTIGVTMDCVDVARAATFWRQALGYEEPHPVSENAQFHGLLSPDGGLHHLTLQQVSDMKATKNRVHLDLFVDDLDDEVSRLIELGATVLAEHNEEGGYRNSVLGDPEGNEFCVVERK